MGGATIVGTLPAARAVPKKIYFFFAKRLDFILFSVKLEET